MQRSFGSAWKFQSFPTISVEFKAKAGGQEFAEESVVFNTPAELFNYIAPGGDCEKIPDEVDEIQMVFLQPEHENTRNPLADRRITLELGMVLLVGPMFEIIQTAQIILDKAERGELSSSFLTVIGEGV